MRDIANLKTRNARGDMVPLGSVATFRDVTGPYRVPHNNLYPAAEVQGATLPGFSTGQAIAAMERLAAEVLPDGFAFEWTELAYQEKLAGDTAIYVFIASVVFVFLFLAAQYESWLLPLAVILIVPMCLLAAITGVLFRGLDNNILVQIGLIVLVGLAAKNAILIVEFAKQREEEGEEPPPGRGGRRPHPPAPDPDDLVRLHPGRGAAGDRHRRRCRDAPVAGHRRVLGHAGRDAVRPPVHAGVLCRHALGRPAGPESQAGAARGGAGTGGVATGGRPPSGLLGAGHDHRSRSLTEPTAAGAMVGSRQRDAGVIDRVPMWK